MFSPVIQQLPLDFVVRAVFMDNSKSFNKVWHEGLIFKQEQKWCFW